MNTHSKKFVDCINSFLTPLLVGWLAFLPCSNAASLEEEWPITDFNKSTVDLNEIISGGPTKDGIPPIDNPVFVKQSIADKWLGDNEPVIVVRLGSIARAYPLQILIYHEIVNDEFENTPISVTFCPLCNASIVFDRRVNERVLDFGTTGRLRKSDLVMYDRQTQSWWQQFIGSGIVGHYAGTQLKQIPAAIVAYKDFKKSFPQQKVLSRDTGHSRPYGRNPYRGYDGINDKPFLFFDPVDTRLPAMERVLGVTHAGHTKVYPLSVIENRRVINDTVSKIPIVVFGKSGMLSVLDSSTISRSKTIFAAKAYLRKIGNQILDFKFKGGKIVDTSSGSEWNIFGQAISGPLHGAQLESIDKGVHFAFAWLAFKPESEIFP